MPALSFEVVYAVILSLNFTVITSNISFSQVRQKDKLIYTWVNFVMIFLLSNNKCEMLISPILVLSTIIYLKNNIKNPHFVMAVAAFSDVIFLLSSTLAEFIAVDVFNFSYSQTMTASKAQVIRIALICLIAKLISKIIKGIFIRVYEDSDYLGERLRNNLSTKVYIAPLIVALDVNIFAYKGHYDAINKSVLFLNAVNMILVVLAALIMVYIMETTVRSKLRQQWEKEESKQIERYANSVEVMSGNLRRFEHDYANILYALGSYIETGDYKGLERFYKNELLPESKAVLKGCKSLDRLSHIKINAIKGVIAAKIEEAENQNIETSIEIMEDINEIAMGTLDLTRIVGILLDNAVEGAAVCDTRKLSVAVLKDERSTVFIISNSCTGSVGPISRLYEENYTTKGEGRGAGLKIVRAIIDERYENVLINTSIKNCVFRQELITFDKKQEVR